MEIEGSALILDIAPRWNRRIMEFGIWNLEFQDIEFFGFWIIDVMF